MISFVVSVLDRPRFLNCCLASLHVQRETPAQIIVACNGLEEAIRQSCKSIAELYGAEFVETGLLGAKCCYDSANMVIDRIRGEWVCFPSDDSLYVFDFSTIMLRTASKNNADLVYSDCVYRHDKGTWPDYEVLVSSPKLGRIDKTNFILKRRLFGGFPPDMRGWRDGALIDGLVKRGAKAAKAPGVLVVHQ